eukprot:SAG11_NODE_553_length_8575_cov_18.074328_8_plen_142_part_00
MTQVGIADLPSALGKRSRGGASATHSSAGPGPRLRRFCGPNVPFRSPYMPRRYRGRPNGVKYQRNRRRYKSKYPRSGSRVIALRPRSGAVVPSEVNRTYIESNQQVWPQAAGPGTGGYCRHAGGDGSRDVYENCRQLDERF